MGKSFEELKINNRLCQTLKENGLTKATPVQEAAIPPALGGKDIVVQAQTGTGKTLAFLLPIMEKIKVNAPVAQALIVAPTRELALQITQVAKKIGEPAGVRSMTVYGGQAVDRQIKKLGQSPQIIVGTPGRLLDHARRKTLDLSNVNKVVLDEADQMLHMGFLDEVEEVLKLTAGDRQTMFFSATIPDRIRALSFRYMRAPQDIQVRSENVTLDEIEQIVVDTSEDTKLDRLCAMINEFQPYLAIVFCHTKQRVMQVAGELVKRGYLADELHGELTQAKRNLAMRKFSAAKLQILVATDIAARGLDVEGVTHVFNYDIPRDAETYIHRIGRTGRAGETGKAITFVNARQHDDLRAIERAIKSRILKEKTKPKETKPHLKEKPTAQTAKTKELTRQGLKRAPKSAKTAQNRGAQKKRARPVRAKKAGKNKKRG